MSKYCDVCGRQFDDNPKFITENGTQMCEECYLYFHYETSKSTDWSTYCKILCYIIWVIFTAIGALIGILIGMEYGDIRILIFLMLGTSIGIAIGSIIIALIMTFLTLCDNISIITRNTAKILMRLDEINDI